MFNKPNVFGRNEPATARDSTPVLGSANQPANGARPAALAAATRPAPPEASPAPAPAASNPPAVASAGPDADAPITGARLIVGPDVKLKGAEILDCDTLVVEGRVEATMDSRLLRIAEKGSFAGKVSIDIAEIYGTFEGELTARSQLIIHSTGRVSGTVRFGKLVVDEGGELNGEISVISAHPTPERKPLGEAFVARSASVA